MIHPNELDQQIENLRTLQQSESVLADYINASMADAVAGKAAIAQAITDKGVTTQPDATLADMASKVDLIQQETYQINGGDMYAKQLFGALSTPNYWNLYEVMAQLLSDGRFVNYGGILLAEYYKGYATIALSGAGAGGGYVTSDGQYYTEDVTHTWNDDEDGKGNRWIAYLFASEEHDFAISDTNTSPRSIHIGRKVGNITCLVNTRISDIVVTDGNSLKSFNPGNFMHNFGQKIIMRNLMQQNDCPTTNTISSCFIEADKVGYSTKDVRISNILVVRANEIDGGGYYGTLGQLDGDAPIVIIKANKISGVLLRGRANNTLKQICVHVEEYAGSGDDYILTQGSTGLEKLLVGYITNDKSKSVKIRFYNNPTSLTEFYLQSGYCKSLDISQITEITESTIYSNILQRLKQDEEDCGDGVTITLGATNLAKLTSQESIDLLDALTNTYGYTFA